LSRIAIVTGGGTGLGKAIARELIAEGYLVSLAGRRVDVLEAAAAELGTKALVAQVDVTDATSVANLFDSVAATYGRLDLLVNNAGVVAPVVQFEDTSLQDWQRIVAANLTGVFLCMQAAFRIMKRQRPKGGRIINNGSVSATTPRPLSAPYTATKHGVTGLTKSGALDGREHDIAVGQIDIGNAATAMTGFIQAGALQADGSLAAEPTIDPRDVARAVVYMASLPLGSNVLEMTVMATKMPFVGRG
jgi:NAD(P)-dependent dehydrogenase (short-subunit alcohol dehydrogenase family)